MNFSPYEYNISRAEIQRLQWLWQPGCGTRLNETVDLNDLLSHEVAERLDLFDRLQLEAVVRVCRESSSLSEAGRQLFDRSRTQRAVINDADRPRNYLLKFGLSWGMMHEAFSQR
jgi:transcriptional regulatory protein RtcR